MTVHITEEEPGFFLASSPNVPELMIGHDSVQTIMEELPDILAAIVEKKFGVSGVLATPVDNGEHPDLLQRPWVIVLPEIIHASRQRFNA